MQQADQLVDAERADTEHEVAHHLHMATDLDPASADHAGGTTASTNTNSSTCAKRP